MKQKSMQYPKHRMSKFAYCGKSIRKKTFQSYEFLTYFTQSRNPNISQKMGWVNSHFTKQVWENTDNSQVLFYLTDMELIKTHTISNAWKCLNTSNMEIFSGKPYCMFIPGCRFLNKFGNLFSQFMENRWEYPYFSHSWMGGRK